MLAAIAGSITFQAWENRRVNLRRVQVDEGVLRIAQHVRVGRTRIGTDVSGPVCIYAQVRVSHGTVVYLRGEARVVAPTHFAVFLPPFTIVHAVLERCEVASTALAFRPFRHAVLPRVPLLLVEPAYGPSLSVDQALGELSTRKTVRLGPDGYAAPVASQAKVILDREYATPLGIARIAERLHVSPAVLSRAFHSAYGMPPVGYRHHLRIMDALIRFAEGAVPIEVFQDVGFDDLSRFYKIFRKVACAPPGSYRPPLPSRNAKT